jgi:hypothetical protein
MKRLLWCLLFLATTLTAQNRVGDQGRPNTGGALAWPITGTIACSNCGGSTSVLMADTTANPTIPQTAAFTMVWNTATWDRLRGDTTNGVWVNLKSSVVLHAIIDSGTTVVTQPTAANLNATVAQGTAAALTSGWPSTNGTGTAVTTTITSSTTVDSVLSIATGGMGSAWVTITPTGTVSTGTVNFETSDDGGTTWKSILGARQDTQTSLSVSVTITASTQWSFGLAGALTNFRVRLNPVMTGTGSVVIRIQTSGAPVTPTTGILNTVSVNVSTLNGAAIARGNGVTDTGTQRVTLSSDTTGILAVTGTQANNAAITANPLLIGAESITAGTNPTVSTTGNIRRVVSNTEGTTFIQLGGANQFSCFVPSSTTVTTQCQAAPAAGLRAYVTHVSLSNAAATVQTLDIVYGTGTNCGTGTTAITHKWQMGTNATTTSPQSLEATFNNPLVPVAANAICVRPSAATAFGATLTGFIAP